MGKHIEPFDNRNEAIIAENDDTTPLCYFNSVKLVKGWHSHLPPGKL